MKRLTGKKRFWLAPLFLGGLTLLVFVTMFLWNSLMPGIFHLTQINYWQAAGLLILSRLLFGFGGHWGGRPGHRENHLREKWEKMSPEDREKFQERFHKHRRFWDDMRDENKDEKQL
jgi:hypothetical protein